MNKLVAAVLLGSCVLFLVGCSSIPAGTDKVEDLLKNGKEMLGKKVVVVGFTETKTSLSSFRMFQLYQDHKSIWVKYPESVEEPPQGTTVRVTGTWMESNFNIIGNSYFVQAEKVAME